MEVVSVTADGYKIVLAQLYGNLQPPNADPLSIEVLAGALEQHCPNCQVEMIVINPAFNLAALKDLIKTVTKGGCRLLGISVPQGTYSLALEILLALDSFSESQRPIVVLGHALPTYMPQAFLKRFPWAIAVRGWGEDALVTLVRMEQNGVILLQQIPGIVYWEYGQLKRNRPTNKIIPQPPKHIHAEKFFPRLETSRGCHYGLCTFCTRPPGPVNYWSRLPLDSLLHSIRQLKAQSITYFTFADEDFIGNDLDGALAIANGIAEIGGVTFSISIRADNIYNPEGSLEENAKRKNVLEALKQAGLSWIFIGVESLSNSQLERYKKKIRAEDSIYASNIVKQLGIELEIGFILFDPFVRVEELRQTTQALRASRLWENVGYLFSKLRVQKATSYESKLRIKGLLGELDVNMLSYEWQYQDQRASEVASACQLWADIFDSVYKAVRNIERTHQEHSIVKSFITEFRALDLNVLEHLLTQLDDSLPGQALMVDESYHAHRYRLVEELRRFFPEPSRDEAERQLIDEIDGFLSSRVH